MSKLLGFLGASLLAVSFVTAQPQRSNCNCQNCTCTPERHCGCYSESGCKCSKGCRCGQDCRCGDNYSDEQETPWERL